MSEFIARIEEHDSESGGRLGRHVRHDPRSRAYRYRAVTETVASQSWPRHIPILDQGNLGSCTGNALVGALGTSPLWDDLGASRPVLDESLAVKEYSEAEVIDGGLGYPPEDQGSSGLSVCQAGKNDGLLSGYTHGFALSDVLAALQAGPVLIGCNWYSSFDQPDMNGLVKIDVGAFVRGGHEVVARQLDVTNQLIGFDNSWGAAWGKAGSFWMSYATLTRLLAEQGDATVPVPVNQPVPVPVPADADQVLWSVAGPWAAQPRTRPDLVQLRSALQAWAAAKGFR